jgi:hypothetical protein
MDDQPQMGRSSPTDQFGKQPYIGATMSVPDPFLLKGT